MDAAAARAGRGCWCCWRGDPADTRAAIRRAGRGRRFDLPGAATVTAAMLLLVYAVVGAPQAGWASARTLGSFAGRGRAARGVRAPSNGAAGTRCCRLGIFRSGSLTRANLGALVLFGSYVSFQFLVTQYLQIHGGLVGARPPRWRSCRPASWWRSPRRGWGRCSTGSARPGSSRWPSPAWWRATRWFLRVGPQPDYPAVILPVGAADRRGVRARVLVAEHPGDGRGGRRGAGPGLRHPADLFQIGGAIVLAVVTAVVDAHGGNRLAAARGRCSALTGPRSR